MPDRNQLDVRCPTMLANQIILLYYKSGKPHLLVILAIGSMYDIHKKNNARVFLGPSMECY